METEPTDNISPETFVEMVEEDTTDSLFEESILNSSFGASNDDEYLSESFTDEEYDEESPNDIEDELEHNPGDLVSLRGLFDEDAVDSRKVSATLDFEEIPDDIDIDEPVEFEELSRAGRIMNVVVKATLIIFALIVLGFIINAGLVIGAVLSSNFQNQVFIDVSRLDKKTAQINAIVKTEISNFGSFIVGELETDSPVRAHVYLSNEDMPNHNDAIFSINYMPPKDDAIKFNGGKRQIFHLEKIDLNLNPNFDSSRLSGFMEPRSGDSFHVRYPRNLIVHFSANLVINSFWIPIPYAIDMFLKVELDKIDEALEKKKGKLMKEFDFNPKFVDISPPVGDKLTLKVRQPVPKFFAPPSYKVAVHMPAMEFVARQFTMKNPQASPDIKELFENQSSALATVKLKPFRMMLADDDLTPNILDIDAEIYRDDVEGLMNVLKAIRDLKLDTLAFLFASRDFVPKDDSLVTAATPAESENQQLKPQPIEGCTLVDFMKTFWGRQAYPVAEEGSVAVIPSVPELYDSSKDSAIKVEFNGIVEREGDKKQLSFKVSANTHFVISEYNLPLLMLSGELPPINFKMNLKTLTTKQPEIVYFKIIHVNPNDPAGDAAIRPLGKNLVFNVLVEIKDLKLLTHFALKLQRMSQVKLQAEGPTMDQLVGRMFNRIEGAEIVADYGENWVSKVASVFDMKFDLSGDKIEFIYSGNGKSVIQPSQPKTLPVYSEEAEEELTKKLNALLELKLEEADKTEGNYEKKLRDQVELLKGSVQEAEARFHEESGSVDDFTVESKLACQNELKAGETAGTGSSVKELVADTDKSRSTLEHHEKLAKVRKLLADRIELLKVFPVPSQIIQNSLFAKVDSTERVMNTNLGFALHQNDRTHYDRIVVKWKGFSVEVDDHKGVHLGTLRASPGSFDYSLSDGVLYAKRGKKDSVALGAIVLEAMFGPTLDTLTVKDWMKAFRNFYNALTNPENIFVPFHMSVKSEGLSYGLKGELPAAGVPALPIESASTKKLSEVVEPGFFDNLAKSHFDFIGYGFYQLIFHAILPNPDTCPAGTSLLNVELNLPPTSTFLFASADSGDLKDATCVASVNTARPLRLWTQIVNGVLCNGYAVAEGFEEQVIATQARISREKSAEIIDSFDQVLQLRRRIISPVPGVTSKKASEHAFLNAHTSSTEIDLETVPIHKRFALITAVPVNVEILDFEHLIKIVDAFGEKLHVQFGANDPTITGFKGREEASLFNIVASAVASRFPVDFNTKEQVQLAAMKPPKIVHVKSDEIVLDIATQSPNPSELTVNVNIKMPRRIDEKDTDEPLAYVPYETLSTEKRFLHPIIRWGHTRLQFAFSKFILSLELSPGDIKITNDGDKIIFDALKDFEAVIDIKARNESKSFKETFKTKDIRDMFKKCQDYYNRRIPYEFNKKNVIETTSSVEFGSKDNQKFNFSGLADIESFFLLQAVLLRKMFAKTDQVDENYDPADDPTFIDFGMLISLGDGDEAIKESDIPRLAVPCFFTNFCSAEQLDYTKLNEKGLLRGKGHNYIPVNLHIRNTFQPLTASIAAGFSTFLSLFHMESYPKTLVWKLHVPENQATGMEMNGQGMFHGLAGPFTIEKSADIPYENGLSLSSSKSKKKGEPVIDDDDTPSNFKEYLKYSDSSAFEREFYKNQRDASFKDEVIIAVKAQVPDSLPDLLRKMMWPMYFVPMDTITLHPPLMNVENHKPDDLGHAPIAVALSDSMVYKDTHGNVTRPSLLTKIFSAFIEESSSSGIEVHNQNSVEPSSFRLKIACDRIPSGYIDTGSQVLTLITDLLAKKSETVDFTVWMQFPWAMGSIGFDFGPIVDGIVNLTSDDDAVLLKGQMTHHHMIGKIARMRLDLSVPVDNIWRLISVATRIVLKYGYSYLDARTFQALSALIPSDSLDLFDIPLSATFNVDNNFIAETEFIIPSRFVDEPAVSNANAGKVTLHATRKNVRWIIEKYGKSAPQAIACIYNQSVTAEDYKKQSALWTKLDLSMTRVYYSAKLNTIKPGNTFQLFLQLRTFDQLPVCGLLEGIKELALKIEYMKPTRSLNFKDHEIIYETAQQNFITSVFTTKLTLERTGRYKIYAALRRTGDKKLEKLRYKEIKFAEIYVQNAR